MICPKAREPSTDGRAFKRQSSRARRQDYVQPPPSPSIPAHGCNPATDAGQHLEDIPKKADEVPAAGLSSVSEEHRSAAKLSIERASSCHNPSKWLRPRVENRSFRREQNRRAWTWPDYDVEFRIRAACGSGTTAYHACFGPSRTARSIGSPSSVA